MQNCIICDLDGVYFDSRAWGKYAPQDKEDREGWNEFHKHVEVCKPNHELIEVLIKLNKLFPIIFLTSRESIPALRSATLKQIKRGSGGFIHIGTRNKLFMRKANDYRSSAEVKKELLKKLRGKYTPLFAIDDDLENVKMFEKEGIKTIHYTKYR